MGAIPSVFAATTAPAASEPKKNATATSVSQTSVPPEQQQQLQQEEHIDQCGFEDDGDEWVVCDGPVRIKDCRLTPEEQAKFRSHIDQIFSYDTLIGHRVPFDPDDVMDVMIKVREYLDSEPMLIDDVPFGVTIVGDLHGQLHDLYRVFNGDARDGKPGWENMKYLFLGDYVDRGRQSLEIVMALFCLKMLYPDRIFLLRGNHEFAKSSLKYGFPIEMDDRYMAETAEDLYFEIHATFCWLSVAAIVGNQYFCAHGGISLAGFTRKQLKAVPKPYINSNDDVLVHDIVWSDPARGLRGAVFNGDRQSSLYFGLDTLVHALSSMQCITLFRAHTVLSGGYEIIGGLVVSIFTATGIPGGGNNHGAVAVVDERGKLKIRRLLVDLERVAWEKLLKKQDDSIDGAQLKESVAEVEEKDQKTVFHDEIDHERAGIQTI